MAYNHLLKENWIYNYFINTGETLPNTRKMKRQCGKKCHKNISSSDAPEFNSPTYMDEGIQNRQYK